MKRLRGTGSLYLPRKSRLWWMQYSFGGKRYRQSTGTEDREVALQRLENRIAAGPPNRRKFVNGLTPSEAEVAEALRAEGYTVLRDGWPDFLAVREVDGVVRAIGVEVKAEGDVVRPNQILMHEHLARIGLRVVIVGPGSARESRPVTPEDLREAVAKVAVRREA